MNRRFVVACATLALLIGGLAPSTAVAQPPSRHFERLDVSKIDSKVLPFLADPSRQVNVMLELGDQPAIARPGLGKAQKVQVAVQLRARQDALRGGIAAVGAKVLGTYQYTYDGIKVRTAAAALPALAALPGVVAIHGVQTYSIDNVNSVPFIGAPSVWTDYGNTGAGQTVAVIDTGIDYTHANFGGPGTPAAFASNDPTKIEVGTFPTAKVVAGWDFAGNGYDADGRLGSTVPSPDPDPLDCNGHGSHVSGTIAGDGVLSTGATYGGPYGATTYTNSFEIGPGVAPAAKLVALKVFGCEGTTLLVGDALEWVGVYNTTHADAIGVVNMSLGAPFGRDSDPDSVATNNLVGSGVVVVASAGNEGPNAYVTGAPGVATRAISVAAEDTLATFPSATVTLPSGPPIGGINQNASTKLPLTAALDVLVNGTGGVKLGCAAADYAGVKPGEIVAVKRGVCAFVEKGHLAEASGASAIIVINRDDTPSGALPTYIGPSPSDFDIPMIGVPKDPQAAIIAANGQSVTLSPGPMIANPTFKQLASFSSGGPRNGDSAAKPDVTAPGVSIVSTASGSGNRGTTLSGTSMASPHVAGVAALVRTANATWDPTKVKAAIMNTANASAGAISPYNLRVAGAGLVRPREAVDTVALATTGLGTASLSFGYDPLGGAYSETLPITLWNTSASPITYDLAGASIVSVSPSSVTVPANGSATVDATAALSAAAVAGLPTVSVFGGAAWGGVGTFRGAVVATPTTAGTGIYPLRVPFLGVPRGLSNVTAADPAPWSFAQGIARTSTVVANSGIHAGAADVYAWGLSDPQDQPAGSTLDVRAVGVQSLPTEALTGSPDPNDRGLIFAVNTWGRWSTASSNEFDIPIYGSNKHKPDFIVVGFDFGYLTAGIPDGRYASFIFDSKLDLVDAWVADGPANGSTVLLPALASDIGQTTDNTRFWYGAAGFSIENGSVDLVSGQAEFSAFTPAISTGDFVPLDPGASGSVPLIADVGKVAVAPVMGWLVVSLDDANGAAQAEEIPIPKLPPLP